MKMTKQEAIETLEKILSNIKEEKKRKTIEFVIATLHADHDAPDWSKAPRWAQWYATDADGSSLWYEHEPKLKFNALYRKEKGISMLSENLKRVKLYKRPEQ